MRYNRLVVDAGRYMPRLTHWKVVKPMVEMFLVVFAAMTFVVALISLTVFIIDVINRKKSSRPCSRKVVGRLFHS